MKFYSSKHPFSNFYPCAVEDPNTQSIYPTSEHAFQAFKFPIGSKEHERIRTANHPRIAKALGRKFWMSKEKLNEWNINSINVMMMVLEWKLKNQEFRDTLLSTGDDIIEENSPYDYKWGIGKDGNGQNLLGQCLMELRDRIKK